MGGAVQALLEFAGEGGAEHLAAEHDATQAVPALGWQGLADGVEEAGHGVDVGDAVVGEQGPEGVGLELGQRRGDDDGGARDQRQQQLADGHVEAHGDGGEHAVAHADGVVALAGMGQVEGGGVAHAHGFGQAGGAGGVDDVGQGAGVDLGQDGAGRGRGGGAGQARGVEEGGVGGIDEQRGGGVVEHELQAGGGVGQVQGQVDGAGLEDGEQANDGVERAGQGHGDDGLVARAEGGEQLSGQGGAAGVEFGVAELERPVFDGHGLG